MGLRWLTFGTGVSKNPRANLGGHFSNLGPFLNFPQERGTLFGQPALREHFLFREPIPFFLGQKFNGISLGDLVCAPKIGFLQAPFIPFKEGEGKPGKNKKRGAF